MWRRTCVSLCVVGVVGLAAVDVMAQPAAVTGVVVDRSGSAVTGATVEAPASGTSTLTDAEGTFVLLVVPPAQVVVRKPSFREARHTVARGDDHLRVVLDVEASGELVHVVSPIVEAASFDTFGSSRTVVSADQIESLNAVDLASALRRTPGVTVSRYNPVGAFGGGDGGAVYIRGTGSSRPGSEIAAYVDGVPFTMGIWGHPLLDLLPVASMDRVTVLKGPQPQAFGNTFSAIDMATRRPARDSIDAAVRVSAGSFGTVVQQADVAGGHGRWGFAAAQGFARSDGHRPDADGRLANAFGRVDYRVDDVWTLGALVLQADNRATDPGPVGRPELRTGRYETSGTLLAASVEHQFTRAAGSVQVYANRGEGNWFDQPAPDGDTLTRFALAGLRWRESLPLWPGGRISGGLDVDRVGGEAVFDRVPPAPPGTFDAEALTLVSPHVAAEQTWALPGGWALTPSGGVRTYRHSVLDGQVAPHAGLVARHARGVALRAAYARGVHYPGQEVVALASLIPPLGDTWRTLEPEAMDHLEFGVNVTPAPGTTIDASYFHDRVRNRYVFGFPPVVPRPTFANLGAYRVRGGEIALQQRIGEAWQGFAGLTLLDPSLDALPYAPGASLVIGLNGAAGRLRLSLDAQAQSGMTVLALGRTAGAAATAQVDGFTVVNVRPAWVLPMLGDRTEVFCAIENLFDAGYAYRPGYPMPGTSVQVGVTLGTARR